MSGHRFYSDAQVSQIPASFKMLYSNSLQGFLLAGGTTVPSDASTGYAKGCLFIHTDGTTVSTMLYTNIGDYSSCNFDALTGA